MGSAFLDNRPQITESSSKDHSSPKNEKHSHHSTHEHAGEIDLSDPQFSSCLSSAELNEIKDRFIASLPEVDTLKQYSASLMDFITPTPGSTEATGGAQEQTESSWLSSIGQTALSALGINTLSTLGTTVVRSATQLVDSVANLKTLLSEESIDQKQIDSVRTEVDRLSKTFTENEKLLHQRSPEEAARIAEVLAPLKKQIQELEKALQVCENGVCQINECAQNEQGLSDAQKEEFEDTTGQAKESIEKIKEQIARLKKQGKDLEESNQPESRILSEVEEIAESVSSTGEEILSTFQTASAQLYELAEASGLTSLMTSIATIAENTLAVLSKWEAAFQQEVLEWSNDIHCVWERGQSLEYYIDNPSSMYAAYNNQFELGIMREQKQRIDEGGFPTNTLDTTESPEKEDKTPAGFRNPVLLSIFSRKILHGIFDEEGVRRTNEKQSRKEDVRRFKQTTNQDAVTNINGELSAADRMTNMLNRFFNR